MKEATLSTYMLRQFSYVTLVETRRSPSTAAVASSIAEATKGTQPPKQPERHPSSAFPSFPVHKI
jgi:hypothetical protein